MPNTEVKLSSAENTCLETDREDRKVLAFSLYGRKNEVFIVTGWFFILYLGTLGISGFQIAAQSSTETGMNIF